MDTVKALIKNVDEDYLTGLSNKGTVKRAAKDLEKESPVLTWTDEGAEIALKEEKCVIRAPLTESGCTCPSRSICRHIVTAVLWMKKELKKEASGQEEERCERFQEILDIPAEKLKRACGSTRYRNFLAHIRNGALPPVEESSVVTVSLPWDKATVKLLLPFSGSSCTCHSRELCAHKAQAVLAYQLARKAVTLARLETLLDEENSLDEKLVFKAAASVCETLGQQMGVGLSRQSPEETESLERLAIIAHRAKLPSLESSLRALCGSYEQYFSRSAAFRGEELLGNMLSLYRLAGELKAAAGSGEESKENGADGRKEKMRALAGNFRDTYEPVGKLHLAAMGGRSFSSKTGYAGEIYYFLETEQKMWYTWTDVRPTIYGESRRRPPANSNGAMAPWGLNCSRAELQNLEFDLQNAKAASGVRLSVSQESRGEITGNRSLGNENICGMIWWDFEKMLKDYFFGGLKSGGKRDFAAQEEPDGGQAENFGITENGQGRREKLALAGAVRWDETVFDTVSQRFTWSVFDSQGRALFISVKYTKEEKMTVQLLERMEKRLRGRGFEDIVFFGSLYLDGEGRLCLYPIEVFFGEASGKQEAPAAAAAESGGVSWEILTSMKQYLQEAEKSLLDIFYSGTNSLWEEVLSGLVSLAEDGERLGLHQAGICFSRIAELLKGKRHQMEFEPGPVIEVMEELLSYIRACREKLSYDMALAVMKNKNFRKG